MKWLETQRRVQERQEEKTEEKKKKYETFMSNMSES